MLKYYNVTIILLLLIFTSCKKEKSDDNLLLASLLLLNKSAENSTSDLNTPIGKAVSISSAISGITSGVASGPSGGISLNSKDALENAQRYAMNTVLTHGKYSLAAKNAVRNLFELQSKLVSKGTKPVSAEKRLTAWSSSSTDSEGYTSYTFSGSTKGYNYTKIEADLGAYTSTGGSCKVSSYATGSSTTGRTDQGTATFTNGIYKSKSSGTSSTGITYSYKGSASVTFSNYGTLYADMFKSIAFFKKLYGSGGLYSSLTSSAKPTCELMQSFYKELNDTYNMATIDGSLSYSTTNDYVFTSTSSSSKVVGTFISTTNADVGVKMSQGGVTVEGVTFKDLKMTSTSDYTYVPATTSTTTKYSGKYTITVSGTVSGSAINETITVSFD